MNNLARAFTIISLLTTSVATAGYALSDESKITSDKCDALRQQDGTTFALRVQQASALTLRWKRTDANLRDRFRVVEVTFDNGAPDGLLVTRSPFRFFAPDSYAEQLPTVVSGTSEAVPQKVTLDATSFSSRVVPCSAWRTFTASATQ